MPTAARIVEPELLDSLPHDAPEALRNRRDIARINWLMGTFGWFERRLRAHSGTLAAGSRVVELGAGDGALGLHLRPTLDALGWTLTGVDLAPRPAAWPAHWGWRQEDLLTCDAPADAGVVLANLILHQFNDDALRGLAPRLARTRLLLASEPLRSPRAHLLALLLFPVMNRVSRHDAVVSVRGGFRPGELAQAVGLAGTHSVRERATLRGGLRLEAVRAPR
jgi:hypothetical protein